MVRLDTLVFIFVLASTIYLVHQPFLLWLNYTKMEMYSYLTVTPIVLGILIALVLKPGTLNYSLQKTVFSLTLSTLGLLALTAAVHHTRDFSEQMFFLGVTLILLTPIIYFSKENSLMKLTAVTLASLTMVPIPTYYLTGFSIKLTHVLLALSIPLTKLLGVEVSLEETHLYRIVVIPHGGSYVKFNIAPICSGIIGLLSVVALTPLITYIGFSSKSEGLLRKVLASVVGVSTLAALLFLANVLRLVSVFYFTNRFGEEVGYNIFHHTPEIILAIPITLLTVKLIEKINGGVSFNFKPISLDTLRRLLSERYQVFSARSLLALATPILLLIVYAQPLQSLIFVSTNPSRYIYVNVEEGPVLLLDLKTGEYTDYVPQSIEGVKLRYYGRLRDFEEAAGATSRIHFYRGVSGVGKIIDVYVEFADLAGDIHLWEICLPVNEINITLTKVVDIKHPVEPLIMGVREIHFKWGNYSGMLFYWRDRVYTEKGLMYFRATAISISFLGELNAEDRETLYSLTKELSIKNMETSFTKHARRTMDVNYLSLVYAPVATGLITIHLIINTKGIDAIRRKRVSRSLVNEGGGNKEDNI